jgi:hypothetical protein
MAWTKGGRLAMEFNIGAPSLSVYAFSWRGSCEGEVKQNGINY